MSCRTRKLTSLSVYLLTLFLLLHVISSGPAYAGDNSQSPKSSISVWSPPLKFFQKYISKADGDRCPMYPSCLIWNES